jgi:branched-chain amino acid transport system permease protein
VLIVWSGLTVGAIYALVAMVFNIVFVASGTFNFAQPQFLMLGTFVAYTVVAIWSLSIVVAIVLGIVVGAAVGAVEEIMAIFPLRRL